MKRHLLAALLLTATAGTAPAQDAPQATNPAEATVTKIKAEELRRDKHQNTKGFAGVHLRAAHVADVDLNGDGHISFDELLRFDVTKDF